MTNDYPYSVPPAIRRIAQAFRWIGWVSFWAQVVLAVVASGVLLFSGVNLSFRAQGSTNPGAGMGLLFSVLGVVAVYVSAYWAFRYTRLGRRLLGQGTRPTPKDALQSIRIGLMISLGGMLVTLLGGQALIGSLIGKALSQPQNTGFFVPNNINQYVEAFDIFVVQANINTLLAHFISLSATLWLLRTVNRA